MNQPSPPLFAVTGLPPGLLGESYAVVAAWQPSSTLWVAEFHLLTSRPAESWVHGSIDFDITNYPPELNPIDETYMEGEALQQAELALLQMVEKRAEAESRPEILWHPFRLEPVRYSAMTLWTRGVHQQALRDIAATTGSAKLRMHLRLVMSVQRLRS